MARQVLERSFKWCASRVNPGPFIFNVFLKDLLPKWGCLEKCDLYNYADDNTAGLSGKHPLKRRALLKTKNMLLYSSTHVVTLP